MVRVNRETSHERTEMRRVIPVGISAVCRLSNFINPPLITLTARVPAPAHGSADCRESELAPLLAKTANGLAIWTGSHAHYSLPRTREIRE